MSIVAEIKCARCDRKYSGVRSRCPYCGARRIGRGKYSEETDNTKGKMLISVLIMSALVVAAGVLLFTTPPIPEAEGLEPEISGDPVWPGDDATVSVGGTNLVTPTPEPATILDDEPDPEPIEVQSVRITYVGSTRTEFTVRVGERVPLEVRIEPPGVDEIITWESSNQSVFEVVPNVEGTAAIVTGVGVGQATLTVTVGDVVATCIVVGAR